MTGTVQRKAARPAGRRHRGPRARPRRWPRVWLGVTVAAVPGAFVVGDGVAALVGVPDQGTATPGQGSVVVAAVLPLVLVPALLAWRADRRGRGPGDRSLLRPGVVAAAVAAGFALLVVVGWLGLVASWGVDRL